MTNSLALWLLALMLGGAIVLGQAAHLADGRPIRVGFVIMLKQLVLGVLAGFRASKDWVANTAWFLNTAKQVLQAVLLSGAGIAGYWYTQDELQRVATTANLTAFLVFAALIAACERRTQVLSERQAHADRLALLAQLATEVRPD